MCCYSVPKVVLILTNSLRLLMRFFSKNHEALYDTETRQKNLKTWLYAVQNFLRRDKIELGLLYVPSWYSHIHPNMKIRVYDISETWDLSFCLGIQHSVRVHAVFRRDMHFLYATGMAAKEMQGLINETQETFFTFLKHCQKNSGFFSNY